MSPLPLQLRLLRLPPQFLPHSQRSRHFLGSTPPLIGLLRHFLQLLELLLPNLTQSLNVHQLFVPLLDFHRHQTHQLAQTRRSSWDLRLCPRYRELSCRPIPPSLRELSQWGSIPLQEFLQ